MIYNFLSDYLSIVLFLFIALAASALLLYLAAWGSKFINLTISTVMSRLVGILLAAIAIQIILNGLNELGIISI